VAGAPLIVGGEFVVAPDVTSMLNAGSVACVMPSVALMMMLRNVPVLIVLPVSRPVEVLKAAHDGQFATEKRTVRVVPVALGWNAYVVPAGTLTTGVPLSLSDVEDVPPTVMLNGGNDVREKPSLAVITMLENLPVALGVPRRRPVLVSNVVHEGAFEME